VGRRRRAGHPWGFEVESIRTPVLVRHGRQDRFVPFGHSEWLARHVPSAQAALSDDDGHLTLIANHIAATHEWPLERMGAGRAPSPVEGRAES
jgi:pimeloyl-ACP methyl ester carboxylesterase